MALFANGSRVLVHRKNPQYGDPVFEATVRRASAGALAYEVEIEAADKESGSTKTYRVFWIASEDVLDRV